MILRRSTPEMKDVTKAEFYNWIGPRNVHPRPERDHVDWVDQRTYAIVGRSYPGYMCEGATRYQLQEARPLDQ